MMLLVSFLCVPLAAEVGMLAIPARRTTKAEVNVSP